MTAPDPRTTDRHLVRDGLIALGGGALLFVASSAAFNYWRKGEAVPSNPIVAENSAAPGLAAAKIAGFTPPPRAALPAAAAAHEPAAARSRGSSRSVSSSGISSMKRDFIP